MNQYFEEQETLVPTIMANFTCFTGNCTSDVLPTITSTVIPEAPAPHYSTLQVIIRFVIRIPKKTLKVAKSCFASSVAPRYFLVIGPVKEAP